MTTRRVFWGAPPEHLCDLWMEFTALPKQQHFAVDPGWPPPAPDPVEHRPAGWTKKPPKVPHVFLKPHVLAVECPVCGSKPSRLCRDIEGRADFSHRARYDVAADLPRHIVLDEIEFERAQRRAQEQILKGGAA